jgi:hypothetical protein
MKMNQAVFSETLAYKNSDARDLTRRKHTTLRTWQKFEIKNNPHSIYIFSVSLIILCW